VPKSKAHKTKKRVMFIWHWVCEERL